jgi:hypothetical protein
MASYTNNSREQSINFTKPDGTTVSIGPGETADLDIDPNDPQVKAQLEFGNLQAADKKQSQNQ